MRNNILEKGINPCSSCGLCAVACPMNCITINNNEEGFYRPQVDEQRCNSCHICKKVCYQYLETCEPFLNFFIGKEVYGAWSKNEEIRISSSSGGVGHELISHAIKNGYNACGVIFNANSDLCKHQITSNIKEAENFKGSKYLQSYTLEAFKQFKKNAKYIVVGTPCQIYGLRQWIILKNWERNFILIDFFCHGTPSYLLWKKYKQHIQKKYGLGRFKEVLFRSKEKSSWHNNAMKISDFSDKQYIQTKAFQGDLFFKFFLSDSCLNESCYKCKLRLDYSASDIRLGDFWGRKFQNNESGVSLIIINNTQGQEYFDRISPKLEIERCTINDLMESQPCRFLEINEKSTQIKKSLITEEPIILNSRAIKPKIISKLINIKSRLIRKILRIL